MFVFLVIQCLLYNMVCRGKELTVLLVFTCALCHPVITFSVFRVVSADSLNVAGMPMFGEECLCVCFIPALRVGVFAYYITGCGTNVRLCLDVCNVIRTFKSKKSIS